MKAILDLYIYSSLHIAICAACLTLSSYFLLDIGVDLYYLLFVGAGTWLLYSLHRIVGIKKVADSRIENRFALIRKFHNHLIIYALVAGIFMIYAFLKIPHPIKVLTIGPGIFALLYILPVFLNKNRLRDFNYLKIFLVCTAWVWLCAYIPSMQDELSSLERNLFLAEKFMFIFGITLPFDFRDLEVDKETGVKTLAHIFGDKTLLAVSISLGIAVVLTIINPLYSSEMKIILLVTYLLIDVITRFSMKRKSDYYYSGIIDGTMILFYICVVLFSQIS